MFPAYSKWEDVGVIETSSSGMLRLLQVRHRIKDNKKQFRRAVISNQNLTGYSEMTVKNKYNEHTKS